jgi:diadenosine tetraphosphatase ApaH/serine/threonine PP2A family protein phosphatase
MTPNFFVLDHDFDEYDDDFDNIFSSDFIPLSSYNDGQLLAEWKCKFPLNIHDYDEKSDIHLTHVTFIESVRNFAKNKVQEGDTILTDAVIETTTRFLEKIVSGSQISFIDFGTIINLINMHENRVKQPTCVTIETNSPVILNGDIHGSISSLLFPFFVNGAFMNDTKYVFLGDYLDRGPCGLECITFLITLKFLFPNNMFLLRGNHEDQSVYMIYGTYSEICKKFRDNIVLSIVMLNKIINYMSYYGIIQNKIFICHGMPCEHILFDDLKNINSLPVDKVKTITDILIWSDPQEVSLDKYDVVEYSSFPNIRGIGYTVPWEVTKKFLSDNNFDLIVRAHQCVMDGYQLTQPSVITLFGQTNYCGIAFNKAAFMHINVNGEIDIITFTNDNVQKISETRTNDPYSLDIINEYFS